MKDFEDPAYKLDYRAHPKRGTRSCANLVTLIKGPFAKQPMEVYVRRKDDPTWTHIKAKATISDDHKTITVEGMTKDGPWAFEAEASTVLSDMDKEHPKKSW